MKHDYKKMFKEVHFYLRSKLVDVKDVNVKDRTVAHMKELIEKLAARSEKIHFVQFMIAVSAESSDFFMNREDQSQFEYLELSDNEDFEPELNETCVFREKKGFDLVSVIEQKTDDSFMVVYCDYPYAIPFEVEVGNLKKYTNELKEEYKRMKDHEQWIRKQVEEWKFQSNTIEDCAESQREVNILKMVFGWHPNFPESRLDDEVFDPQDFSRKEVLKLMMKRFEYYHKDATPEEEEAFKNKVKKVLGIKSH